MNAKTARLLFQIAVQFIAAVQRAGWYKQGREAALAEMSEEQRRRIALANAARADADAFASGELRDPRQRD